VYRDPNYVCSVSLFEGVHFGGGKTDLKKWQPDMQVSTGDSQRLFSHTRINRKKAAFQAKK